MRNLRLLMIMIVITSAGHEGTPASGLDFDCTMLTANRHMGVDLGLSASGIRFGAPLTDMTDGTRAQCMQCQARHLLDVMHACQHVSILKGPCAWQRLDLTQPEEAACGHQIFSSSLHDGALSGMRILIPIGPLLATKWSVVWLPKNLRHGTLMQPPTHHSILPYKDDITDGDAATMSYMYTSMCDLALPNSCTGCSAADQMSVTLSRSIVMYM